MRRYLFIMLLGAIGLLAACSAPKPSAQDSPAHQLRLSPQEAADFNRMYEK